VTVQESSFAPKVWFGKKYLVCADSVMSKTDGDIHHISANQLMGLYNVSPKDCLVWDGSPLQSYPDHLLVLRPRYRGDYDPTLAPTLASQMS